MEHLAGALLSRSHVRHPSRRRRSTVRRPIPDANAAAVAETEQAFKDAGYPVLGVVCGVSDESQVESMVQKAVQTFGRLDMAFNNAGIIKPAIDTADERAEDFDRVQAVNAR